MSDSEVPVLLCVLRTGGDYGWNYVHALIDGASRHSPLPFQALVLTDQPKVTDDALVVPLAHRWPGWWSKIEAFRTDLPIEYGRPVVYLDLDTVVVGSIAPLLSWRGRFAMRSGFRLRQPASGMMAWRHGMLTWVYHRFRQAPQAFMAEHDDPDQFERCRYGDQGFIAESEYPDERCDQIQPGVYSYKRHCRDGLPSDATVVQFHGRPRPHECSDAWIPDYGRSPP